MLITVFYESMTSDMVTEWQLPVSRVSRHTLSVGKKESSRLLNNTAAMPRAMPLTTAL